MVSRRQTQVAEAIAHQASQWFARESNRESLITVTRADVSPDLKNVTIFISVMPASKEGAAIAFAKRNRGEFREYLKSHSRLKTLPNVEITLDYGEKNRQLVDDLTRGVKA